MAKTKATTKLILEFMDKHPDMPSRTLAKLVYGAHESVFNSVESIRTIIRSYRGANGDYVRNALKNNLKSRSFLPQLPIEDSEDYKPLILDKKDNNIGVISDLHIPNHRNNPLDIALQMFEAEKVNTILINGDLLDNTPFTKFLVPPDKKDAKTYLDKSELFLENLRMRFPTARIIWLEGNHDYWYYQYLMRKAPELYGDEYYHLSERLNLSEYKIEFLPQAQYLMAGKLAVCHGHFLLRGVFTPVSAARSIFLKAKVPVLVGHCHTTSESTKTNLHGEIMTTWSTGCLCTLTPDYMPMGGEANHGFAMVKTEDNGHFRVKNFRVHKGEIY